MNTTPKMNMVSWKIDIFNIDPQKVDFPLPSQFSEGECSRKIPGQVTESSITRVAFSNAWFNGSTLLCVLFYQQNVRYRLQKQYPKNHITDQGSPHEPKLVKLTHSCLSKTSASSAYQLRETGRFVDKESIRELNMFHIFNSYLARVSSQRWVKFNCQM